MGGPGVSPSASCVQRPRDGGCAPPPRGVPASGEPVPFPGPGGLGTEGGCVPGLQMARLDASTSNVTRRGEVSLAQVLGREDGIQGPTPPAWSLCVLQDSLQGRFGGDSLMLATPTLTGDPAPFQQGAGLTFCEDMSSLALAMADWTGLDN